jgi:hypothetical protein
MMRDLRLCVATLVAPLLGTAAFACGDSGDGTTGAGASSTGGAGSGGGATTTSTGGAGGGGGAAPRGSVQDYCAPLAELLCARASTCGCSAVTPSGTFDESGCVAAFTSECAEAYASVEAGIDAGVARVDAGRVAECLALVSTSTPTCEAPRGAITLGLCPAWFTGDDALGAPCTFPICGDGAGFCDQGTCVPRPGSGDACDGLECAPGLLCLDGQCGAPGAASDACATDDACAPPLRCVAGACAALGGAGDACDDDAGCSVGLVCGTAGCEPAAPPPCASDVACGNLSSCVTIPRCATPASAGGACTVDEGCAPGNWCDAGQCAALPGDGQPCANGAKCAAGLACATDFGDCAPLPGDGAPCAFGPMGPNQCASGLGCLVDTCGPMPGAGEACTIDNRCAAPLACDFTPQGSVCVTKKPAGGACQNDQVCDTGLHCDYVVGTCAADHATGAPCKLGNECGASAVCLPSDGLGLACAPMPALGDPCLFDCEAGLFCQATAADAVCVPGLCGAL